MYRRSRLLCGFTLAIAIASVIHSIEELSGHIASLEQSLADKNQAKDESATMLEVLSILENKQQAPGLHVTTTGLKEVQQLNPLKKNEQACNKLRQHKLRPGDRLDSEEGPTFICSPNGLVRFGYGKDGDLYLWNRSKEVWSTTAKGRETYTMMQGDGNLVLRRKDTDMALWSSGTHEYLGSILTVDNDGGVRIRRNKKTLWEAAAVSQSVSRKLDILIAGFPKCGTSSVALLLRRHNETAIPNKETCKGENREIVEDLSSISGIANTNVKYGIKCPDSLWDIWKIQRLEGRIRLIIGVRHPILFFQSFYNYRVTEAYRKEEGVKIPPAESLIEKHWKFVSATMARYELSLMQLGKVPISNEQLQELQSYSREVNYTTSFQIFLYSIEQLGDENENRSKSFRHDLQNFLGLESPLNPLPHENVNTHRYPETIDICESRYDELREVMLRRAVATRRWILYNFAMANDVVVGGFDHFKSLLLAWDLDPCKK